MNAIEIEPNTTPDEKPVEDVDGGGTKSYGCGNSFYEGRCIDGSDPTDCVYEII